MQNIYPDPTIDRIVEAVRAGLSVAPADSITPNDAVKVVGDLYSILPTFFQKPATITEAAQGVVNYALGKAPMPEWMANGLAQSPLAFVPEQPV